ncbi:MAG: nucleotidyltransferase domain-containing protein [Thermoplasmatales archaeon]
MLLKHSYNGVEVLSLDKEELKWQLKKVGQKIKLDHPEAREMIVFGSFLKDNYTPYSDIDVAIVVERSEKKFIERIDDFIDYFLEIPLDINVLVYTRPPFTYGRSGGWFRL